MQLQNRSIRLERLSHKPLFALAQLVSPQELKAAIQGHEHQHELEKFAKSWLLQGDCSKGMVEKLRGQGWLDAVGRLDYVDCSNGFAFAVLTKQIETHQHRFILPLWDPKVAGFIRGMKAGNYRLSFTAEGTQDTVVVPGMKMGAIEGYQPVLGKRPAPEQMGLVSEIFPSLLAAVGELEGIETLIPQCAVEDVSVSVLMDAVPAPSGTRAYASTLH